MVVTQPQPTGHAFADAPEAFRMPCMRLQGLAVGMKTDALSAVGHGPSATVTWPSCPVPHITSGRLVVMQSLAFARRCIAAPAPSSVRRALAMKRRGFEHPTTWDETTKTSSGAAPTGARRRHGAGDGVA